MNVNDNNIDIRGLGTEDVDKVVILIKEGIPNEIWPLTIYSCQGYSKYIAAQLSIPTGSSLTKYFGLFIESDLLGYAEWRIQRDILFLNNIYVMSNIRGLGLGEKLLVHGISLAKKYQLKAIQLDVFNSNQQVRLWYRHLGFHDLYTSKWALGHLPEVYIENTQSNYTISNYPDAQALQEVYGFSSLNIVTGKDKHTVGRLGKKYFRITNIEALHDEELLKGLHQLDPERLLLCIIPEITIDIPILNKEIAKSTRMERAINI